MLFSSIEFLFYFFPAIIFFYFIFKNNTPIKNTILLIFSLCFYAFGEPKFVLILLVSTFINYILGLLVDKYRLNKKISYTILTTMCIVNLGLLFIYKYLVFFISNVNNAFNTNLYVPNIILPIGISFFTFQAMSYVIDVYRQSAKVQKNPFYLALYISFFPQLIAGPIVRYQTISEQILNRKETMEDFSIGTCRFIIGISKKVIISNQMAIVADHIYELNAINNISTSLAWLGSIAYTLQIFFDFSAYSDMAIGLGRMFGFKFDENFNYPYISKSISEFWRRWHISLGSWFKNYLYFPLGGSKVNSKAKLIRNLFIVWLCTGIWHGANWTFILWGLLNLVFILIERTTKFEKLKIPSFIKNCYCLLIVNFGWVLFRADSLVNAKKYLFSMFNINVNLADDTTLMFLREYFIFFILAIIFSTPISHKLSNYICKYKMEKLICFIYPIGMLLLFALTVSYLVMGSYNPFIYFNF